MAAGGHFEKKNFFANFQFIIHFGQFRTKKKFFFFVKKMAAGSHFGKKIIFAVFQFIIHFGQFRTKKIFFFLKHIFVKKLKIFWKIKPEKIFIIYSKNYHLKPREGRTCLIMVGGDSGGGVGGYTLAVTVATALC